MSVRKAMITTAAMTVFAALFSIAPAAGADRKAAEDLPSKSIAVLDFKADGVARDKALKISELARTELINRGAYQVLERSQVDMIMKEHRFNQTGITDNSTAIRLGVLLQAKYVCIGTVMKLGDATVITARIVDVEKGVAVIAAKARASSDADLLDAVSSVADQLSPGSAAVGKKDDGKDGKKDAAKFDPAKVRVRTDKASFAMGQDITVTFEGFPGTRHDYISIAKKGANLRDHVTYQWTRKAKSGSIVFYGGVAEKGDYEVRAHVRYNKGSMAADAISSFSVK